MDLSRFTIAHQNDFETALREIKSGKKRSHWMWYIFPQIYGLGYSYTSQYYAIQSLEEAKAFLADPYLGRNLISICEVLIKLESNDALEVFGSPDNMKLQSCMTLFSLADNGKAYVGRAI
jgi:uncharacterized protein (DUF1810 family)